MVTTALAVSAMITASCASVPPAKPVMSSAFASGQVQVRKLAILPVDLSVMINQDGNNKPPPLDQGLVDRGIAALVRGLQQRGYDVAALVDQNGVARTVDRRTYGSVIHPVDLDALRARLHQVTRGFNRRQLALDERVAARKGEKPSGVRLIEAGVDPKLLASLARLTNTEAALYTRAWAYVNPNESNGSGALTAILVILGVLVVVGAVFGIMAASKGKSKGKVRRSRRRGRRSWSSRRSRRAGRHRFWSSRRSRGRSNAAAIAALHAVDSVAQAVTSASRSRRPYPPCSTCPPPPPPPAPPAPPAPDLPPRLDEPGIQLPAPPPSRKPSPPAALSRASSTPADQELSNLTANGRPRRSKAGMALSLVDTHSGRVLWHVEQEVMMKLYHGGDVVRLVDHFLKTLPPANR